ncbi:helix-turn-helix domain-containing protein [Pseudomonas aeruginosa]|uniref:helix-turn-helix domain-containing protein n=1 Tax=Pseudomonas aeruginosa TaxID=287 RepID=UPI003F68B91E
MVKLFGLFDASKDGEANCPTRPSPGTTTFDAEPALAFGAAVRVARLTQGVAQEELAAKAGIERSHMGKIERGEHMPTLALILRIAAGLKLSAAELVSAAERNLRAAAHDSDRH